MKFRRILQRLSNRDGYAYIFGRFLLARRSFSALQQMKQRHGAQQILHNNSTVFSKVGVGEAVTSLQRDAICFGFDIGQEAIDEIYRYSLNQPLTHGSITNSFMHSEVSGGRLAGGQAVAMGHVSNPEGCKAITKLLEDSVLQIVARRYLKYMPTKADVSLYWSFVGDMNVETRRRFNQTVEYHFDVHDFNFCYAHFYITDCDARSGAHVMVKGSHLNKRPSWLFGSARKNDLEIAGYYDPNEILVIEGRAGTGFIEDTSCFHKALAPLDHDRLLLQIRLH